ncbi:ABC transporter ATP-binding protein [Agrococcus baldri]|uniref:ABC transporter ATP-binding protein n=1 Tax=Agrococcus baldri TaxID=153730 RepID=UPI001649D3CB|nr:ABC transporter ATP-binding protein [Agrococcus baldri]
MDAQVRFGGVRAVDGVTISLERGNVHGLVGPNGSGKTTLVNAISGFARLHDGSVTLNDEQISGMRPDQIFTRGISRTFQSIRLLSTLTVRENILIGTDRARAEGDGRGAGKLLPRDAVNDRVDHAVALLGLEKFAGDFPSQLPYGLQRRVEIARSVASRPELILLDEPFAGMSRAERDELSDVLIEIADDGFTLLVIEHDMRIIHKICSHLFVMNFGRCIAEGSPRETAELEIVQEAYLGKQHGTA